MKNKANFLSLATSEAARISKEIYCENPPLIKKDFFEMNVSKIENKPKYYTPSLEEFCIGLEYECLSINGQVNDNGDWNKFQFGTDTDMYEFAISDWLDSLRFYIEDKKVRVKHLDQEDLEELGWDFDRKVGGNYIYKLSKNNNVNLNYQFDLKLDNQPYINFFSSLGPDFTYDMKIKNKSEMKRLMLQLGIEE